MVSLVRSSSSLMTRPEPWPESESLPGGAKGSGGSNRRRQTWRRGGGIAAGSARCRGNRRAGPPGARPGGIDISRPGPAWAPSLRPGFKASGPEDFDLPLGLVLPFSFSGWERVTGFSAASGEATPSKPRFWWRGR